jgi:ABC-2 type transport system ATP-binding protein
VIEANVLTKDYGDKRAVDGLSFEVRPGTVTGFLGPNGSGKSTTMRLILGLDRPTSGSVVVNGKLYREHTAPLHEVGALLEARSVHTGRSARNHLLALAQTHGISRKRVDELIDVVGLHDVAKKRAGQFSLGMGQRLGIATALLGDPQTVMLDEPVNGLDPEGIHWIPSGSRPLAGSSRIRICGSASSAAAIPSRWPMPSENCPTRFRATSWRPTRSIISSTRPRGIPWVCARASRWL